MQKRRTLFALAGLTAAVLTLPTLALAQEDAPDLPPREFPPHARRGRMTPGYYPEIVIDGKTRRLSPSSRIFNQENLIEMPAALRGSGIAVSYTEDRDGDIDRVWILTREEARRRPRD